MKNLRASQPRPIGEQNLMQKNPTKEKMQDNLWGKKEKMDGTQRAEETQLMRRKRKGEFGQGRGSKHKEYQPHFPLFV